MARKALWPPLGGTFEVSVEAVDILQAKDSGQLVTVCLRVNCDEGISFTVCCTHAGEIASLLHISSSESDPVKADKDTRKIDLTG
jgi:hypothetical protein